MRNIDRDLKLLEIDREYARLSYPAFFEEISRRIDLFISCLKEEQANEDSSLSLEVGRTSSGVVPNRYSE